MKIQSLSDLANQHALSILGMNNSGTTKISGSNGSTSGTSSPFAQMLSELQQVEQSSPAKYSQLTQQISTKLSTAAGTAQTNGNSALATKLSTLSQDFASASQTGQMVDVRDLESAMHNQNGTAAKTGAHSNPFQFVTNLLGKVAGI